MGVSSIRTSTERSHGYVGPQSISLVNKTSPFPLPLFRYQGYWSSYLLVHYCFHTDFKRVLGLETNILSTFTANFEQVADSVIHTAKEKRGKSSEVQWKLKMLGKDECDDNNDMEYL